VDTAEAGEADTGAAEEAAEVEEAPVGGKVVNL